MADPVRLCIADPPYPPRVYDRRDVAAGARTVHRSRSRRWYGDQATPGTAADFHPEAGLWDTPEAHRDLIAHLAANFDGWAIATTLDGAEWYAPTPAGTRHLVWHKTNAMPNGSRIHSSCELVLAYTPHGRRRLAPAYIVPDLLSAAGPRQGFAGAKPPAWTRWVLDALAYDPDQDELVDMFPGSGAVSAAAAQGVLL